MSYTMDGESVEIQDLFEELLRNPKWSTKDDFLIVEGELKSNSLMEALGFDKMESEIEKRGLDFTKVGFVLKADGFLSLSDEVGMYMTLDGHLVESVTSDEMIPALLKLYQYETSKKIPDNLRKKD